MQLAAAAPLRARYVLLGAAAVISVLYSVRTVLNMPDVPFDWSIFVEASARVDGRDLYADSATYSYRYSPVLANGLVALGWLGPEAWRLLHVVAALAMPTWSLRIVTLLAWPFWHDVETGNLLVFVLLPAAWALRGNRFAGFAFLALTLLIPRPLMIPVAAWLLWRDARYRLPFAAMAAAHLIAVVGTGWAEEWTAQLIGSAGATSSAHNLSPSRWLGVWWLAVGLPLAAWLTARGRVGLAALAVSPYLLPQYVLMAFLELVRPRPPEPIPAGP